MNFLTDMELEAIFLSLKAAFWGTACALPFALVLALVMHRFHFPGKSLLNTLIHLPLIIPPVALGYLLLLLFGRRGVLGGFLEDYGFSFAFTWKAAALAAGVMALPLMVRAMRIALEAIDPTWLEAARTLGRSPFFIMRRITLPLAAPGILAGTILGFARAWGEFGATITFAANIPGETRTLPLALYTALQAPGQEWVALRLALLSLAVASLALAFSEILLSYLYPSRLRRRR